MPPLTQLAGIVLCGGNSRRMGQPKAWLPFAGTTLLEHVVRTIREVASPVVVVSAVDQKLPPLPADVMFVYDANPDRGPLEGLSAGLMALTGRAESAFVTSCDAPFNQAPLVGRLHDLLGDHSAAVPLIQGRFHPLTAVYRVDLLPRARRLLDSGRRRMLDLLNVLQVRSVGADELRDVDPDLNSLCNLNTPDEYAAAVHAVAVRPDAS